MSEDRDILFLRSVAKEIIEHIWKTEFYNDAENYILYRDPRRKRNHRSESEISQIESDLSRLKDDLVDEVVEEFNESGLNSMETITNSSMQAREICYRKFAEHRRRWWNVIKPGFPSK